MPEVGLLMMTLEKMFDFFSDAFLQDMKTALTEMEESGITVAEFLSYARQQFSMKRNWAYESKKRQYELKQEYFFKVRRCAFCGNAMSLYPVNDQPCNQVGGAFQSMWECSDVMGCGETVYVELPVNLEAAKYGLEKFFLNPEEGSARRKRRSTRARQAKPTPQRKCCGQK
jgi:hypothetical protein